MHNFIIAYDIFDKKNSKFLSTDEAYKVYKYAYNQRDRIEYSA